MKFNKLSPKIERDPLTRVLHSQSLTILRKTIKKSRSCASAPSPQPASFGLRSQLTFHQACAAGQHVLVKTLLKRNPLLLTDHDANGDIALSIAAAAGQTKICRILLRANPSTASFRGQVGTTPMHRAAQNGHLAVVKLLRSAGADSWARAALEGGDGELPIHAACAFGRVEVVRYLLRKYPSMLEVRTGLGETPLYVAVKSIRRAVRNLYVKEADLRATIGVLLEHGADRFARSLSGDTPFIVVHKARFQKIMDMFVM